MLPVEQQFPGTLTNPKTPAISIKILGEPKCWRLLVLVWGRGGHFYLRILQFIECFSLTGKNPGLYSHLQMCRTDRGGCVEISRYALNGSILYLVIGAALFSGGCTAVQVAEERAAKVMAQNAALQSELDQLRGQLELQNVVTARLQMELVQKKEEIARLGAARQGLAKEIASNTIRTPAASTKVETVAYLAEVATAIETSREKSKPEEQELFAKVDRYMEESNRELEAEHYQQASLLAAQALELVSRPPVGGEGERKIVTETYADFISPLELKVAKKSNIRKAPGKLGRVLTAVEPETLLTAVGHKGYWIKVLLPDGRKGWIYYSLLSIPKKLDNVTK